MHHKVFILDHRVVITGSFNFSQNADASNNENFLIIDDPSVAAKYEAEYDRVVEAAKYNHPPPPPPPDNEVNSADQP
jgi:phosphatidylserine/phosphatidylglycerophosphate/cardiolipin synthase-like enzyme